MDIFCIILGVSGRWSAERIGLGMAYMAIHASREAIDDICENISELLAIE